MNAMTKSKATGTSLLDLRNIIGSASRASDAIKMFQWHSCLYIIKDPFLCSSSAVNLFSLNSLEELIFFANFSLK